MGIVYEAQQESLGRRVALKLLPYQSLLSESNLERFRREAQAAARLHHTNIIPVYAVGEHEGLHYYTMQLVHGQSLDKVIEELRRLREEEQRAGESTGRAADSGGLHDSIAGKLWSGEFHREGSRAAGAMPGQTVCVNGQGVDKPVSGGGILPPRAGSSVAPREKDAASDSSTAALIDSDGSRGAGGCSRYFHGAARICMHVANALSYAHGEGVLHRDIKPSNLLLDTKGGVWITDFGLAKAEGGGPLTHTGDVVGTLAYMAPERLEGWSDPRSDVYGLGLTLYELLTLRQAFDAPDRRRLMRKVTEEQPAAPRTIDARIPRDLETIVLKAIAKEPAHRYATALQMETDLKRFIEGKPIWARRSSTSEKVWLWCRRNPAVASLTGLAVALLTAGLMVSFVLYHRASEQARRADSNAVVATKRADEAVEALEAKEKALREREEALAEKDRAWKRAESSRLAAQSSIALDSDPALALLLAIEAARCQRNFLSNTALLAALERLPEQRVLLGHGSFPIDAVWFSPDGATVLTTQWGGYVPARLWDAATGTQLAILLRGERPVWRAHVSPDGTKILTVQVDDVGSTGRIWDAASRRELFALRTPSLIGIKGSDIFSPDGLRLVLPEGNNACIRNAETGEPVVFLRGHAAKVRTCSFSHDGNKVATTSNDQTVRVWDAESGKEILKLDWLVGKTEMRREGKGPGKAIPEEKAFPVFLDMARFSPDGRWLVTFEPPYQGPINVWDARDGTLIQDVPLGRFSKDGSAYLTDDGVIIDPRTWKGRAVLGGGANQIDSMDRLRGSKCSWSDDGSMMAIAASDGSVRIFSAENGQILRIFRGHREGVSRIEFSPDGRRVVTTSHNRSAREGSPEGTVCIWSLNTGNERQIRLNEVGQGVSLSRDGRRLAAPSGYSPFTSFFPLADGAKSFSVTSTVLRGALQGEFSLSGDRFLCKEGADGVIWDLSSAKILRRLKGHEKAISDAAFSLNGKRAITASIDGTARIWNAENGEDVATLKGHSAAVGMARLSPDGRRAATFSQGLVRVWEADSGRLLFEAEEKHGDWLAFSPDGEWLALASRDGVARAWKASTGEVAAVVQDQEEYDRILFAPDSRFFVPFGSTRAERPLKIYDLPSGREIGVIPGTPGGMEGCELSRDGKRILIVARDAPLAIWEIESGKKVIELNANYCASAAFTPDGGKIMTASPKGTEEWDATTGERLAVRLADAGSFDSCCLSPDCRWLLSINNCMQVSTYDVATGAETASLQGHHHQTWHTAFSPDGTRVVTTGCFDGTARVWDAPTGEAISVCSGHEGRSVHFAVFSPDGRWVATTADDGTARVWEAESGKQIALLHVLLGHSEAEWYAEFSRDGRRLLTWGRDDTPRVWDCATGKEVFALKGHSSSVCSAQFCPDGLRILTASTGTVRFREGIESLSVADHTVRIWDASTGKQILVIAYAGPALFSPDGARVLASCRERGERNSVGVYRVFDASNGKVLSTFDGSETERVSSAAFSPDGNLVFLGLSAGGDGTRGGGSLWDPDTGEQIARFPVDTKIHQCWFTPDGRSVVAQCERAVRIWPVDALAAAQTRKPRELFPDEVDRFEIGSPEERKEYRRRWKASLLYRDLAQVIASCPDLSDAAIREYTAELVSNLEHVADSATDPELPRLISLLESPRGTENWYRESNRLALKEIQPRLRHVSILARESRWDEFRKLAEEILAIAEELERTAPAKSEPSQVCSALDRLARACCNVENVELGRSYVGRLISIKKTAAEAAGAGALNSLAWDLLVREPKALRDPATALICAEKAFETDKSPEVMDTLALACFLTGDIQRAIELEKDALARTTNEFSREEFSERLERFKKAAAEKKTE